MKTIRFAWINLRRNKTTNLVIAFMIVFGVSALVFAYGFIKMSFFGLGEAMVHRGLGHFEIMHPKEKDNQSLYPLEYGLTPKQVDAIKQELMPFEEQTQVLLPRLAFSGIIANEDRSTVFIAQGVDAHAESQFASVFVNITQGKGLRLDMDNMDKYEVLLGDKLGEQLGFEVGDEATLMITTVSGTLNAVDVEISGFYSTGVTEVDERAVMLPLEIAQEVMRTDKITKMVVGLYDTQTSQGIFDALVQPIKDLGLQTYFWKDLAPFYYSVVSLYTVFFTFLGSVMALVVASSILGGISNAVTARVREFGMLKANGFSRYQVLRLVVAEAVMLSLIACAVAMIVAHVGMVVVNAAGFMMPPPPGSNAPYPLLFDHAWEASVVIVVAVVVIAAGSALKPAWKAASLKIADALRS